LFRGSQVFPVQISLEFQLQSGRKGDFEYKFWARLGVKWEIPDKAILQDVECIRISGMVCLEQWSCDYR